MTEAQFQQAVNSLQRAVNSVQDALENKLLRKVQKDTFLCSAKCCDTTSTRQDLQQCLSACAQPLMETEQRVKVQFEEFQLRHQRCIQRCQDVAVENLTPSSSERDRERAGEKLRKCAIECCTSYEKQIPQLQKNIMNS
ncbi:DUF842 domain-containing protein [Chloropicon primus]|uniref:Protein FAM136A n=1 Tax=Chloropicon primus TaxID=1764295 RepID=A0A5B8MNY8_9CHLO|nr:hypothetical protein A3770_07p47540 [Chloropicon primus]UPR01454.1 DUF842 domain-containing protein [Chloropicon primus]|eukprot:QDZ22236.1 hypothetical protein A3770_07p47540 [Chloropicon primus]